MMYQMRNWYNFTWLSGDFNVEQHVHFLDVCAWVMKDQYPVKAVGMGGRQVLTGPEYGQIYDHFSVVYEYANGAKLFSNCRQQPHCKNDMSARCSGPRVEAQLLGAPQGPPDPDRPSDWVLRRARRTRCTRPSTTSCSPASATASRSTTASTWPRAPCWRSWAAWPPTPARRSPGRWRMNSKEDLSPTGTTGTPHLRSSEVAIPGQTAIRLKEMRPRPSGSPASDGRKSRCLVNAMHRVSGPYAPSCLARDHRRPRLRAAWPADHPRGRPEPESPRSRTANRGKPTRFQIACMTLPYSRFPSGSGARPGIKAAGYRYVAWGTTHQEGGTGRARPRRRRAARSGQGAGQEVPRPGPGTADDVLERSIPRHPTALKILKSRDPAGGGRRGFRKC